MFFFLIPEWVQCQFDESDKKLFVNEKCTSKHDSECKLFLKKTKQKSDDVHDSFPLDKLSFFCVNSNASTGFYQTGTELITVTYCWESHTRWDE